MTRQTALPTSSATSSAPVASIATPTGRPRASPSGPRKPPSTSTGAPAGQTVAERHEDHAVAARRPAVPGSVLADEGALGEARPELGAPGEGEAERRAVRLEAVVRDPRRRREVGTRRLDPRVEVAAPVAPWPAEEVARAHRRQVVRHEVAAELVALVDHGPERAGAAARTRGRPGCADPPAKMRERPVAASISQIAARPRSAARPFSPWSLFEPTETKSRSVGDREPLGPVMVDLARRQRRDQRAGRGDPGLARRVRKAQQRVGVGDVEASGRRAPCRRARSGRRAAPTGSPPGRRRRRRAAA